MAAPIVSIVVDSFDKVFGEVHLESSDEVLTMFKELEEELKEILKYLEDADARQYEEERVRTWIRQARDLAYRSEDLLDIYVAQAMSKDRSGVIDQLQNICCFVPRVKKALREISFLRKEIAYLRETMEVYGINKIMGANLVDDKEKYLRQTFAGVVADQIVGIDDDLQLLVQKVTDTSAHKVISICGMGGIGKTTMARMIYNHPVVRRGFDALAWVCITQTFEKKTTLVQLFNQLTNTYYRDLDELELENLVRIYMKEKKCLVVLDDVWSTEAVPELGRCLQLETGSKILLTTRIRDVAMTIDTEVFIFNPRLLNEDDSLQLLLMKVFGTYQDPQIVEFELLGKEMVRKCGGLPLAISVLGGILRTKSSVMEWKMINENFSSILNESFSGIMGIMAMSYNDLPDYLKPCFLYMCIFEEDQNIDPRKLCHLWIAEGMVPMNSLREGSPMDLAERNLKELGSRGMVQVEVDPILERLQSCQLHSLIRDLCLSKAREEDFLEVIINMYETSTSYNNKTRPARLGIYLERDVATFVKSIDPKTCQSIRTLSFYNKALGDPENVEKQTMDASAIANFKLLRVLDFEGYKFHGKMLLDRIGGLILLRYLSLNGCDVGEFPSSIGDLPLLQTLDLRTRYRIQLPHNIFSKKKRLRHLYLKEFHCGARNLKLQLIGLSELETLVLGRSISDVELTHLSKLANIQYFKVDVIRDPTECTLIMDQIGSWKKVAFLKIGMFRVDGITLRKTFESNVTDLTLNFISSFQELPADLLGRSLISLDILSSEHVDENVMKLLADFPNLRRLCFGANKQSIKEINFSEKPFLQLRSLELYDLVDLEKLEVAEGNLQNLITLRVGGCEKLVIEPEDGLRNIHTLRELEVDMNNMSKFKEMCRKHHSHYAHVLIKEF